LGSTLESLLINQQKYFAFKVDDLDKAQADVNILEGYTGRAAIAIRDVIDTRLLSHYADVPAGNVIAGGTSSAPLIITKDNVYGYCVALSEKMDEAGIPGDDRNLVVPPKFKSALIQCPEFLRATGMGDKVVENGMVGTVANFKVHVTTNSPTVNNGKPVLAFRKEFINFASQVANVENVRPYNMFAEAVKGIYLYGSKAFSTHAAASALAWMQP